MPKSESHDLPEFLKELSEDLRPVRISVNRLVFTSPLIEWPGKVTTPCYLNAKEYHQWWTGVGEGQPEDDPRHWAYFDWETRFHLAKAWNMENLDSDQLKENPEDLPDLRIAIWFIQVTNLIIQEATLLPNSPRPSSVTSII